MKNSNIQISLLIVILFFPFLWKYQEINAQNVAITDDDTYNADSSAMLDIKSISKGMLVPRLTTAQRNAVSNPATGLLVFDTDAGSFYFYNGTTWTNLSSGNANGIIGYTSPDKVYLNDITDKFGIGTVSPSGKLDVKSDVSIGLEKPIFNVVNSTGDTVFAVYEQGVRINVYDDPTGKATANKGGFAVGGFSPAKAGFTNEYLRITPDSVRIYIEENSGAKATANKGGFAVGGFSPAKAGLTNEYLRITNDSTRIYTQDTIKGFGVKNIGASSTTSYMQLTPSNYFIGHESGKAITTGLYNSFMGYQSGKQNSLGQYNSFMGYQSGINNDGDGNNFIGYQAGFNNTVGDYNTYIGPRAGYLSTNGSSNTAIGPYCGYGITNGSYNSFYGNISGYKNESGNYNSYYGYSTGYYNKDGEKNCVFGYSAGEGGINSKYDYNAYFGTYSGSNTFTGGQNACFGTYSGINLSTGNNNTYIGTWSGGSNSTGSNNVFIGYESGRFETGSNKLYIANSSNNPPLIYGDFSTGNVAIGTTSPLLKLDTRGANAKATTASFENIIEAASTDVASPLTLRMGLKTDATATSRYGAIEVDDAGTKRNLALQATGGNVGIGTTTPNNSLTIDGGSAALWNSTTGNNVFKFYYDAGLNIQGYVGGGLNNDLSLNSTRNGSWLRIGSNNGGIAFWANGNVAVNNSPQILITSTGRLGINTTTPGYLFEVAGDGRVAGSLKGNAGASGYGASLADRGNDNNISFDWDGGTLRFYVDVTNVKNFIINHPVDNNKYLVHTTLEGPENGVYYRGTSKLENGKAVVELPEYFDALTQNNTATVILTPKGKTPFLLSYDEFNETTFAVYGNIINGEFDWEVKAERQDVPNIIVEPFKNEITVHGDGPYKYYSVKRNANIFTKYNQFAKN